MTSLVAGALQTTFAAVSFAGAGYLKCLIKMVMNKK